MTFDAARTALGSDIHGLAGSLIPTFDPYRPEELAAKIIERLTPSPKVITTTRSTIGSPPEGFLEHIKYVQNIVIPVSAEISGSLEVSPDNDTANTENTGLIIIPTNFGLFDGGDIQIVGSIEVDATVSCPPGSVAQLFSIVNYAGVEHRFALRRIRSGSTYLSNEPLDFVSISLPQVRVTPEKAAPANSTKNYFSANLQVGIELIEGTGSIWIYVNKATLRVSASGLSVVRSASEPIP
jgi:hypothetical protein